MSNEPHHAIIDIGSNSIRLVVYDRLSRAPFPRFNEKSLCGLGRDLRQTGKLPEDAMQHAIQTLRRFTTIASAMGAGCIDILATEAVRRASNGQDFINQVEAATKIKLNLLSGEDEAYYAAMGVLAGLWKPNGIVGDMGGGSLEIAEIADGCVSGQRVSLPLGALPVTDLLDTDPAMAKNTVDCILDKKLPPLMARQNFYLVGGGWRALARIHMMMEDSPVKVAHGYEIEAIQARKFVKSVWQMPTEELSRLQGIPPRRVATLPAAALVLDRLLKRLHPDQLVVSALGLREGWLYAKLPEDQRTLDPLIEGARAFGVPRARVSGFCDALENWTAKLFPSEQPEDRRLRETACKLSDLAWADHVDVQAFESFQKLLQFPFIGLNHTERVLIAAAVHARYGGKQDDPGLMPALQLLGPSQRRRSLILGRAMLLAYRFSGSVPDILNASEIVLKTDRVQLVVRHIDAVPDSDAVRARLKRLAKVLDVKSYEIVQEP